MAFRRRLFHYPDGIYGRRRLRRRQPAAGRRSLHRQGRQRPDGARRDRRGGAARGARARDACSRSSSRQADGRVADRRRHVGRRHAHLHRLHAAGEGARRRGGDGQPAADAEAQFRTRSSRTTRRWPTPSICRSSCRTIRRSPASRWSRRCWRGSRKEIPAARTIKLEDPPTPFKTARILEASAGDAGADLRRPRRRVPARGADRRRDRRDDRLRVPGDSRRAS